MLVRWIAALAAFGIVVAVGIAMAGGIPDAGEADPVTFAFQAVADVIALILGIALLVAIAVYLVVERIQTGTNASVTTQFTTRTLILMPIAIALNIILGQTVAAALKIPIYLDSIGTILVGVLAGPLAGAADRVPRQRAVGVRDPAAVPVPARRRVRDRRRGHRPPRRRCRRARPAATAHRPPGRTARRSAARSPRSSSAAWPTSATSAIPPSSARRT